MKTWEEAEFEAQQESIRKWAKKRYFKIISGWWMRRRLKRLRYLAEIITGDSKVKVEIETISNKKKGAEQCCKAKEMRL